MTSPPDPVRVAAQTREPWQCSGCGLTNPGYALECDGCGEAKATATLSRPELTSALAQHQREPRIAGERPDWFDDKHVEHVGGVDWYEGGKKFRALPRWRRIFHVHRAQTRVWWHSGLYLERCICGAYGLGGGHWRRRL